MTDTNAFVPLLVPHDKLELELDGEAVDTGVPPMPMTPDLDEAAPVEADPVEMGQDEGIQDR